MLDCSNCGRLAGPGGATGLCSRCYQHRRRHGELPAPELIHTDKVERLVVRIEVELLRLVEASAKRAGEDVSTWVRGVLRTASAKRKAE